MTDSIEEPELGPFEAMAMAVMSDLAAPQPLYLELIAQGGFVEPMPGFALSYSRENTDYLLRHHEQFSSVMDLGLGNVRPLIPLNVDPPTPVSAIPALVTVPPEVSIATATPTVAKSPTRRSSLR